MLSRPTGTVPSAARKRRKFRRMAMGFCRPTRPIRLLKCRMNPSRSLVVSEESRSGPSTKCNHVEKFGGNLALTTNRGRSISTHFREMSHEGLHVNFRRAAGVVGTPSRHARIPGESARAPKHYQLPRETSGETGNGTCPGVAVRVRQSGELLAASGTRQPGRPSSTHIG